MSRWQVKLLAGSLLAGAGLSVSAYAASDTAVGRLLYSEGVVSIVRDAKTLPGNANQAVYVGDVVNTGDGGDAQWRMGDASYMAQWKNSSVELAKYSNGQSASYLLNEGGLRILSGSSSDITLQSPTGKIQTTDAADFTGVECKKSCYHNSGELYPDGLYVKVAAGTAKISAGGGAATASISPLHGLQLASASADVTIGRIVADAAPMLVAANDSSLSASAVAYVYVGSGAAPKLLSTAPDFFSANGAFSFKIDLTIPPSLRNLFDSNGGQGQSESPH